MAKMTSREEAGFHYSVAATCLAYLDVTGASLKAFYLDPKVGIDVYRRGRPIVREIFGEDVAVSGLSTPHISYGHINCLGAELVFPEDGDVNHGTLCHSLDAGIDILRRPVDFSVSGMFPFYMDYRKKLQGAFPGESVGFGFGAQGPVTTAYALRRDEFFYDFYDNPDKTKEFFDLITQSVIAYRRLVSGHLIDPSDAGLCDDLAAMVPPELWPAFVLPYEDRLYRELTIGKRSAHIEDLRPEQLPFLDQLGLSSYDPSVSPKLNPKIIREKTRVPFAWRLCDFHYPELTAQEVRDFVVQAAADGASRVFTLVANGMTVPETVRKVKAFIEAGKAVAEALDKGASRDSLVSWVSPEGKKKFWDRWP